MLKLFSDITKYLCAIILVASVIIGCNLVIDVPIKPGEMFYDIDGNPLNVHGGGILRQGDIYYFYGEYRVKDDFAAPSGVGCYTSQDLVNWTFEGIVLQKTEDTTSLLRRGCIIERPKVLYNANNDNYVMWFHHELYNQGYDAALTGLAVSDSPTGLFEYRKSIRPNAGIWPLNYPDSLKNRTFVDFDRLGEREFWREEVRLGYYLQRDFQNGQMARDMTLFERDGKAYHVHSSENNQTLHISELDDDFTGFTGRYVRALPGGANEAPAVFAKGDKLFMITSGCTGWRANAARLSVSEDILGDWQYLGNPVDGTEEEEEKTFYSQSTFVLPYGDRLIFMGDRWNPKDIPSSEYVWLPMAFENEIPVLKWQDEWSIID